MIDTVLVLGGYGNFGGKISAALSRQPGMTLIVAGRSAAKAAAFAERLTSQGAATVRGQALDLNRPDLTERLRAIGTDIVIHTSGPFQAQDYRVVRACIAAGCHYIDLADGRRFVNEFRQLDEFAKQHEVLAVTGASSVPGLSSAVIDEFLPRYRRLTHIDYAIAPGNRADRGEATVKAILSYTGRPFRRLEQGRWVAAYGWQDSHRHAFPDPIGKRWLANCDIPDLTLFPERYPDLETLRFYAGLELTSLHLGMWGMSWLARLRLVKNWSRYAKPLTVMSRWFERLGSDIGGMTMRLWGDGHDGRPLSITWDLIAERGHGPQIPTIPAIVLTKKLIAGKLTITGATPCVGLFSLAEFGREAKPWRVWQAVSERQ